MVPVMNAPAGRTATFSVSGKNGINNWRRAHNGSSDDAAAANNP